VRELEFAGHGLELMGNGGSGRLNGCGGRDGGRIAVRFGLEFELLADGRTLDAVYCDGVVRYVVVVVNFNDYGVDEAVLPVVIDCGAGRYDGGGLGRQRRGWR